MSLLPDLPTLLTVQGQRRLSFAFIVHSPHSSTHIHPIHSTSASQFQNPHPSLGLHSFRLTALLPLSLPVSPMGARIPALTHSYLSPYQTSHSLSSIHSLNPLFLELS